MSISQPHDLPWTVEDYQYFINRAETLGLYRLADVLIVFFKKDFPNSVPDHVMSQRGTGPRERSGAFTIGYWDDGIKFTTVPGIPRKG